MGTPGFWDDPETAGRTGAEHARLAAGVQSFETLKADADDLEGLVELTEQDADMAAELEETLASVEQRLAALEEERLFTGKYDAGDALVTVNAGAGGTDAQDWAEMVLRMMMRWAERRGFKVELLEVSAGEEAGIKSATFRADGDNAYGLYSAEKGVHRLVRLSPFDAANRRQTSFAGVEVAPVVEDAEVSIEDDDLQIDTYRASGAGGQHVNKTDSAVRITHRPTGVVVQCQNERSQSANKATAMAMLRSKLVERAERERQAEIARERGEAQDVNFGSQIRSYVLHPYTMVKDHRTDFEVGSAERVLDGDLDGFVRAWLEAHAEGLTNLRRGRRPALDGWFWRFTWPDGRAAIVLCGVCPGWALVGVAPHPGRVWLPAILDAPAADDRGVRIGERVRGRGRAPARRPPGRRPRAGGSARRRPLAAPVARHRARRLAPRLPPVLAPARAAGACGRLRRGRRRALVAGRRDRIRRAQLGQRLPAGVVVGRGARLRRRPGHGRVRRRPCDRAAERDRGRRAHRAGASYGSASRCSPACARTSRPAAGCCAAARSATASRSRRRPTRPAAHILDVPVPAERRTVPWSHQHLAGRLRVRVERHGRLMYEGESALAGLEQGQRRRTRQGSDPC